MNWIVKPLVIALIFTSCGDSNPIPKVDSENVEFESDSLKTKIEASNKEDSLNEVDISFLDISFIENLVFSWESTYRNAKLAIKGFTRKSSGSTEEKVFENKILGNKLVLSKVNFPEGGSQFSVTYRLNKKQFDLFTTSLVGTTYRKTASGEYKKKGLGTYVEKTIRLNDDDYSIVYVHYVGKETSLPILLPMDSTSLEMIPL
ncbi:MAG: hypothetical protein HRT58_20210 [Crocinitomicaceae bacterium]|nr:hypothetical protein [Flavobacteriales bacterium]NQZ37995.1 hypothetical protein [Crocinitomicaceae bacterium]